MDIQFYTLGVYGLTEKEYFNRIISNQIDTFCDIRRRRAVRGAVYSFVNSKRLQNKLHQVNINYVHEIDLAPTKEIRDLQRRADKASKIPVRERKELSPEFKTAYSSRIISNFNFKLFIEKFKKINSKKVLLFCVEKLPNACHRSLVTDKLKELYPAIQVIHL
jgi:uncharacterized protein (DUF488 family)